MTAERALFAGYLFLGLRNGQRLADVLPGAPVRIDPVNDVDYSYDQIVHLPTLGRASRCPLQARTPPLHVLCEDVEGEPHPRRVRSRDIAFLKALEGPDGFIRLSKELRRAYFRGEFITVRNGLFAGYRGELEEDAPEGLDESSMHKLWASLFGPNSAKRVRLPMAHMERLDA